MEGYTAFRDAAAEGIRRAGCQVVRAEDFPAATVSPRNACLDGVRSADAVVLLLGERYGFITPSGRSVTEEEYDEALSTHKRVLLFLEDVSSREPQQEAFVKKVEGYVGGHWRKTFRTSEDLARLIEQSVQEADLSSNPGAEGAASQRLDVALASRPQPSQGIVWAHAAWTTLRTEEVVDPLSLGDAAFQKGVYRLAHQLEPPLLDYAEPKRAITTASSLRIEQGDPTAWRDARDLVVLELLADGTISVALNITGTEPRGAVEEHFFEMYFLDPEVLRERLARAWAFARTWWEEHDPYRRHDPLLYTVALHDVGTRRLGRPPAGRSGITPSLETPPNPLWIFDQPRLVARASLLEASAEIGRICTMLERRLEEKRR